MFDEVHKLDLSRAEIELIEAALHTQKKILSVQSKAGGQSATARLSDLRQLLKRLDRQIPTRNASKPGGWTWLARSLLGRPRSA